MLPSSHILSMTNEEWSEFQTTKREQIARIHIPSDIDPMKAVVIVSKIDELYSLLRLDCAVVFSAKEKVDSLIREIERKGLRGKNEDDRKKSAVEAVSNHSTGSGMSLYDVQRLINERFNFLEGLLDVLTNKQSRLITVNGLLKLDGNIAMTVKR